ncbi:hypothetical protein C5Y97_20540 [Blastopirellula marina]|uniref:Uncharacterized protein n=1 Tax=Blastopirellula marina TaxID=124 RepID=A0A2S8FF40_9BACT|nr:hypothetical protein C5Y98_20530 [Blastopirellula marina]PTL42638.1 hypothetical protein C5Y97_20540 [Blastopirellula marina]
MNSEDESSIPRKVARSDVADLQRADDRISCLKIIFGTTIGVNEHSFDWCPDGIPPSVQETLGWMWFLQPKLSAEWRSQASGKLARLMAAYEQDNLEAWWQERIDSFEESP